MTKLALKLVFTAAVVCGWSALADSSPTVVIESEGWHLVGDLVLPTQEPIAFALLLHKASGDRGAYGDMTTALAQRSIASLRVDLRGHGDSTNLGRFDPTISRYYDPDDERVVKNFELVRAGDRDIVAIMAWLDGHADLRKLPLVVVGSSYTGQEMVEAARSTRFADLYVALAPGSFTRESIAAVDSSGVPWLFVRAEIEMDFFPDLFEAIESGSETAEIWTLPGEGHATDLFDHNEGLSERLSHWIVEHLERPEPKR